MNLLESLLDGDASIDLLLSDACELCAERCENWVKSRLDIGLEDRLDRLAFYINDDNWELDDFLRVHLNTVVIVTRALKVKDANVVQWRLSEVLRCLVIHD